MSSGSVRKPWQGPLPPRRVSAKLTLGDHLNKANWRRSGKPGSSVVAVGRLSVPSASGAAAPPSASSPDDSNFETRRHDPESRAVGRVVGQASTWASAGPVKVRRVVTVGRLAQFCVNQGVVSLFSRIGRLWFGVSRNASFLTSSFRARDCQAHGEMQGGGSLGIGAGGRSSRWEQPRPVKGAAYGGRTGAAMGAGGDGRGRRAALGGRDWHEEEGEFFGGDGFHVEHGSFDPGSDGYHGHWNRGE